MKANDHCKHGTMWKVYKYIRNIDLPRVIKIFFVIFTIYFRNYLKKNIVGIVKFRINWISLKFIGFHDINSSNLINIFI